MPSVPRAELAPPLGGAVYGDFIYNMDLSEAFPLGWGFSHFEFEANDQTTYVQFLLQFNVQGANPSAYTSVDPPAPSRVGSGIEFEPPSPNPFFNTTTPGYRLMEQQVVDKGRRWPRASTSIGSTLQLPRARRPSC